MEHCQTRLEGLVHVTNMHDDHYDYIEELNLEDGRESIHGKSTNLARQVIYCGIQGQYRLQRDD